MDIYMKKILLSILCLVAGTLSAWAQEEVKVLKMTAVRTTGQEVTVSLSESADFWGPTVNIAEERLVIDGRSLLLSRVREIRFFIDTEITDAVESLDIQPAVGNVYSIDGRLVRRDATSLEGLPKGVYILNGKKHVVK